MEPASPARPGRRESVDNDGSPTSSPSSSPIKLPSPGDASAAPKRTEFSHTLARATMRAPDKTAEKLIDRLRQQCLEEAAHGRTEYTLENSLTGTRKFCEDTARAFAVKLKGLGYQKVSWWNGKEMKDWDEMQEKSSSMYYLMHDQMYDKYTMKIKVEWSSQSTGLLPSFEQKSGDQPHSRREIELVMKQFKEVLELQQKELGDWAASEVAAVAEANAARQRAVAAERKLAEWRRGSVGALDESSELGWRELYGGS